MQTKIHYQILKKLDPAIFQNPENSGVYKFDIFEFSPTLTQCQTTIDRGGSQETIQLTFQPHQYIIRTLRAFIDINTIAQTVPYEAPITEYERDSMRKALENDAQFPRFQLQLGLEKFGAVTLFAGLNLQNKRPGYYINLFRFLTDRPEFHAESTVKLVGIIQNVGYGMPGMSDMISFFGEAEGIALVSAPPAQYWEE